MVKLCWNYPESSTESLGVKWFLGDPFKMDHIGRQSGLSDKALIDKIDHRAPVLSKAAYRFPIYIV